MQLNQPRVINAWGMYDWANSVYSLVITSAIFPVYYQAVAVSAKNGDLILFFGVEIINSVLYSYALSASFLLVALILPLLSGVADYSGRKKLFMKIFVFLGSGSCIGLYFFDGSNIEYGIFCSIFASVGYSGSLVFYDAFLPEIATPDRFDRVSAKGYALGYIGSVLLLIASLFVIEQYEVFGFADKGVATRSSFLLVGLWWFGFSFIPLTILPENVHNRKPQGDWLLKGYFEIMKVWKSIGDKPSIKRFLLAFFFYNMGVQTVMYLAATFGSKELALPADKLIFTVLIIQLVAVAGAYLFAFFSEKAGNKASLLTMIVIWVGICIAAYFIQNEYHFYFLAFAVGMVMGGIQSLSRATYSKLIPRNTVDTASYFSFFDVTFNLSIVVGTFSYGFIESFTGNMRYSAVFLAVYFVLGLGVLITTKIPKGKIQPNN
jgi:MFS transporter, UMF1 family